MLELFRVETETQTGVLTDGLLELEREVTSAQRPVVGETGDAPLSTRHASVLESLMRAAHSLKGAARIVNLSVAVRVAHAMEDCFVAAQRGRIRLSQPVVDVLFRGVDLFTRLSKTQEPSATSEVGAEGAEIENFLEALAAVMTAATLSAEAVTSSRADPSARKEGRSDPLESPSGPEAEAAHSRTPSPQSGASPSKPYAVEPRAEKTTSQAEGGDLPAERVLRLAAENLNRLLGLAGESLVASRWLRPFSDSLQRLRRMQSELETAIDGLRQGLAQAPREESKVTADATPRLLAQRDDEERTTLAPAKGGIATPQRYITAKEKDFAFQLSEIQRLLAGHRQFLAERLEELDGFDRRSAHLSNRLYLEVLRTRMRPFAEGTQRFPRMVRDLARGLGKRVRLEIAGGNTPVDRDLLERLETPLAHLLRNAVDHGCEAPEQRQRAGKPAEAVIQLTARHVAGQLQVGVSDDGVGVDLERLRQIIFQRQLGSAQLATQLNEVELLAFLFLPGFTLKEQATEVSGRGVGLDVVQNLVKSVGGAVRVKTQAGQGMNFELQLPLTLSVVRTLLVEVAGEPYAIPLARITHTLNLAREKVEALEGRHHFRLALGRPAFQGAPDRASPAVAGEAWVGLLSAHEVLDCGEPRAAAGGLSIVVIGDSRTRYGLVVDRFLGERELVVQPLDPRLGKVQDISAAALMEDGSPVLIVDVDDLVCSIERLIASGTPSPPTWRSELAAGTKSRKRILVVDDSLTVRELERKLLLSRGYLADAAVDGIEGWNAVRTGVYDLVITDVDMPRMDGIELATLIKQDAQLKSLPVMIVSYKDREEDRLRGLDAGADYYLTKGSFHDESLLTAVIDLIGEAEAEVEK